MYVIDNKVYIHVDNNKILELLLFKNHNDGEQNIEYLMFSSTSFSEF